ncbi:hypothetical protein T11_2390 [Trichinella zimbabwensis]|uniref:Secreted protein n=1 Tax=Trichinella zimbabwensis TaxID=268475 RepID=A0A0V1HQV9_9BILA|nr:hypothetical protein T11_2390 [Trichinella zimbabwensis]
MGLEFAIVFLIAFSFAVQFELFNSADVVQCYLYPLCASMLMKSASCNSDFPNSGVAVEHFDILTFNQNFDIELIHSRVERDIQIAPIYEHFQKL